MAFIFPEDKNDFTAPNGVTYHWDGTKWVTKTYNGAEADVRLPYRLGTDKAARSARSGEPAVELVDAEDNFSNVKFFGVNGIQIESRIDGIQIDGSELIGGDVALDSYATIEYSDTKDASLQNQIDELGITKGKVARYTTENTSGVPVSRPGQLSVNTSFPPNVNMVSFGIEDSDGVLTKPMADGDIIEFVDVSSGTVSRYQITDATAAPTAVGVAYISGDNHFVRDEEEQVYIYPQNASGASKEYVDEQDALAVKKAGDTMGPNAYIRWDSGGLAFDANNQRQSIIYKASDSFTQWTAYNGNGIKLTARDGEPGGGRTYIDLKTADSGGTEGEEDGYRMKLFHVATPKNDFDGANKKYVDNAVSNSGGGGGTAGIILNLWTYRGQKNSSSGLNDGEFGSKKMANGVLELYLAGKNSQGWFYHPTRPNSTAEYDHQITNSQPGSPMTVTDKYGRCLWYAETKKIVFNKGGSSGVMVEAIKYRAQYDNLVDGDQYILNVAGFLSPVLGWS